MIDLIGTKVGMTRVFDENGVSLPATVIKFDENVVIHVNDLLPQHIDVQIATQNLKKNRVNKVTAGQFTKHSIAAKRIIRSYRVAKENANYQPGQVLSIEQLKNIKYVDIRGTTKGKGFAGTVKAHHFRTQDATHGNSRSHRVPGSIGQRQTPGRVFKGKRMCKQLGNTMNSVQNLKLIRVDTERSCILVMGAVPGAPGSTVFVKPSIKKKS
jgi:large subunit ribosomal protein L3